MSEKPQQVALPLDLFFNAFEGLAKNANLMAFTVAVAVKDEKMGTKIIARSGSVDGTPEWKDEIANLLTECTAKSAATLQISTTVKKAPATKKPAAKKAPAKKPAKKSQPK
jgi:hypothetical protein